MNSATTDDPASIAVQFPKNARWWVAVIAALLGASFSGVGLVAQKHFFAIEHLVESCTARLYWYIGLLLLFAVAAPFDMGAMAFGSLDLVVPFAAITVVICVVLARLLLREHVSPFHAAATLVTATGVALTAAFGAKSTQFFTAAELEDLVLSGEFFGHGSLSLTVFTLFAVVGSHASSPRSKLWALSHASMAAIAGAHVYIVLKVLADFLYLSVHGVNQFTNSWMYLSAVALAVFSGIQVWCLNHSLARCDAAWILPIYQALLTTAWILVSCLMFDEFEKMSSAQLFGFIAGLNLTLWGIAALTRRGTVVGQRDFMEVVGQQDMENKGMLLIQTDEDFDNPHVCDLEVDRWI